MFLVFYLFIRRFGDIKATAGVSPSRVLNFQDGVALLFSSFVPCPVSRCDIDSISSFFIFPLPADHS